MDEFPEPAEASSRQSTPTLQAQLKKLSVLNGMKALFSAYRLDQYTDPDGFKVNIGLVLEQYPIDTIRFVTDPRTGIQPPLLLAAICQGDGRCLRRIYGTSPEPLPELGQ